MKALCLGSPRRGLTHWWRAFPQHLTPQRRPADVSLWFFVHRKSRSADVRAAFVISGRGVKPRPLMSVVPPSFFCPFSILQIKFSLLSFSYFYFFLPFFYKYFVVNLSFICFYFSLHWFSPSAPNFRFTRSSRLGHSPRRRLLPTKAPTSADKQPAAVSLVLQR